MATLVDILLCILAIILPPVPVLIKRGCGINLLINILLCIFGLWIGGTHYTTYSMISHHLSSRRIRSFSFALTQLRSFLRRHSPGIIHAIYIICVTPGEAV